MFLKKLKAISYVELVLVLVIVGIISSLAVPSLKRHSQMREIGKLSQKAFLTLNEAVDQAILVNGPIRNWPTDFSVFSNYIVPQLKVSKKTSSYGVITRDGIEYTCVTILYFPEKVLIISADVNGSDKGPNQSGKDIHQFKIDFSTEKVEPYGTDTYTGTIDLYRNNWEFTDELWNK